LPRQILVVEDGNVGVWRLMMGEEEGSFGSRGMGGAFFAVR
jgi:hypothetical protein